MTLLNPMGIFGAKPVAPILVADEQEQQRQLHDRLTAVENDLIRVKAELADAGKAVATHKSVNGDMRVHVMDGFVIG